MILTEAPFEHYYDLDGDPLDAGYIYYGLPNQNPQTAPTPVFWDLAGTIPAAQPIRTLNGYTVRNGTPANVYTGSDYSVTVLNKKRQVVYYAPDALAFSNALFVQAGAGAVPRTAQDKMREQVSVKDFGAVGNGLVDDTAAIQAALTYAGTVGAEVNLIGGDTYLVATKTTVGSETFFLKVPNNVTIKGPRTAVIKTANNVGNYTAVFCPAVPSGLVTGVTFRGFTIDQNAAGNTTCDITAGDISKYCGAIIFQRQLKSVYVLGCAFINAPGVNTVTLSGANSTDVKADDNYVRFLRGTSTTPDSYDNSAFYLTANGYSCCRNYVENASVSGTGTFEGGRTAVEVHGSHGLACDNWAVKFQQALNVVGYSTGQGIPEYSATVVMRNTAFQCLGGILLWATGADFSGFIVNANALTLNPTKFKEANTASYGIGTAISLDPGVSFKSGEICDNIIQYTGDLESSVVATRSAALALDTMAGASDVQIKRNTIVNAPFSGISIFQQVGGGAFTGIVVEDNLIIDAGSNSLSGVRYGALWRGVVFRSRCVGNTFRDTSNPPKALNANSTNFLLAGSSIVVARNKTEYPNGGTPFNSRGGIYDAPEYWDSPAFAGAILTLLPGTGLTRFQAVVNVTAARTFDITTALFPVPSGTSITVEVVNTSGGLTNITWAASFVLSAAFVQLNAGQRAYLGFTFDAVAAKWYQSSPQVTV